MPSKAELKRRHVLKESHCEACGDPAENLFHITMECSYAKRFWEAVQEVMGVKLPDLHPLTWAKDIISGQVCSLADANVIVCGAWSLWSGRNARNHGKSHWNATAAVKHIAKMLEDLVCMETYNEPEKVRIQERWKPPDQGWVKVNTDGAFGIASATGASGAVLRDELGVLLAAEGRWLKHMADPLTVEAMAARNGLLLVVALGYNQVILEVDNLTLANSLPSSVEDQSLISGLWHEIQELGRSFISFRIQFVRREANSAAHCCAKKPSAESRMWSCVGYTPDWLMGILSKDCNSVTSACKSVRLEFTPKGNSGETIPITLGATKMRVKSNVSLAYFVDVVSRAKKIDQKEVISRNFVA
ncbi:hypothetical protein EJB05_34470, partial [Eragrostis curvula]